MSRHRGVVLPSAPSCFRSLDLHSAYDIERTQAIRLCRHIVQLSPDVVQPSIVMPFIAFANDSSKVNERLVLIALEFLCELGESYFLVATSR